jgi:hypothetical protein
LSITDTEFYLSAFVLAIKNLSGRLFLEKRSHVFHIVQAISCDILVFTMNKCIIFLFVAVFLATTASGQPFAVITNFWKTSVCNASQVLSYEVISPTKCLSGMSKKAMYTKETHLTCKTTLAGGLKYSCTNDGDGSLAIQATNCSSGATFTPDTCQQRPKNYPLGYSCTSEPWNLWNRARRAIIEFTWDRCTSERPTRETISKIAITYPDCIQDGVNSYYYTCNSTHELSCDCSDVSCSNPWRVSVVGDLWYPGTPCGPIDRTRVCLSAGDSAAFWPASPSPASIGNAAPTNTTSSSSIAPQSSLTPAKVPTASGAVSIVVVLSSLFVSVCVLISSFIVL